MVLQLVQLVDQSVQVSIERQSCLENLEEEVSTTWSVLFVVYSCESLHVDPNQTETTKNHSLLSSGNY
jgi:hypothetical protein